MGVGDGSKALRKLTSRQDAAHEDDLLADLKRGLKAHRCSRCLKVLFEGQLGPGSIVVIWCRRTPECRIARHKETFSAA